MYDIMIYSLMPIPFFIVKSFAIIIPFFFHFNCFHLIFLFFKWSFGKTIRWVDVLYGHIKNMFCIKKAIKQIVRDEKNGSYRQKRHKNYTFNYLVSCLLPEMVHLRLVPFYRNSELYMNTSNYFYDFHNVCRRRVWFKNYNNNSFNTTGKHQTWFSSFSLIFKFVEFKRE